MGGMRDKLKKQKGQLGDREREGTNRTPHLYGSIFLKDLLKKYNIPIWFPKGSEEGTEHLIDVLPFLAGPNHPDVEEGNTAKDVGLYVHKNVGPTKEQFICSRAVFNKPPDMIDQFLSQKFEGTDWDKVKQLKATQQNVYFIWVRDGDVEEKKGVQAMMLPFAWFAEPLAIACKNKKGGGIREYADLDDGYHIYFNVFKNKGGMKLSNVALEERDADKRSIPEWVTDKIDNNGDFLHLEDFIELNPDYAKIEAAFRSMQGLPGKMPWDVTDPDDPINDKDDQKKDEDGQKKDEDDIPDDHFGKKECPQGFNFGTEDIKTYADDCNNCKLWDDCNDALSLSDAAESKKDNQSDEQPDNNENPPENEQESSDSDEQEAPRKRRGGRK